MKITVMFLMVLILSIVLIGCSKSNIEVNLVATNYGELRWRQDIDFIGGSLLIKSYKDFENVLLEDYDEDTLYDASYFESKDLYIEKVTSAKNPSYTLDSYNVSNEILHVYIDQENKLERIYDEGYYDATYYLFIEINSKEIEEIEITLYESNPYYQYYTLRVDEYERSQYEPDYTNLSSKAFFMIHTFEAYSNLLPYSKTKFSNITDELFITHDVIVFSNHFQSGEYLTLLDIALDTKEENIIIQLASHAFSNALRYEWELTVIAIERYEDNDNLDVVLEYFDLDVSKYGY